MACPSCGRTLFDLQTTTQRIREKTGHLKGVKIAIMGCIVNGPGEMADADFGYVGGAPGKINLYVGKTPIKFNIPEAEAVDRLVDLIREHGKWVDPEPAEHPEEAGQAVQQLIVGGGVGVPEVVHRIDDAAAHQPVPEAVDDGAGEPPVVPVRT